MNISSVFVTRLQRLRWFVKMENFLRDKSLEPIYPIDVSSCKTRVPSPSGDARYMEC